MIKHYIKIVLCALLFSNSVFPLFAEQYDITQTKNKLKRIIISNKKKIIIGLVLLEVLLSGGFGYLWLYENSQKKRCNKKVKPKKSSQPFSDNVINNATLPNDGLLIKEESNLKECAYKIRNLIAPKGNEAFFKNNLISCSIDIIFNDTISTSSTSTLVQPTSNSSYIKIKLSPNDRFKNYVETTLRYNVPFDNNTRPMESLIEEIQAIGTKQYDFTSWQTRPGFFL